MQPKVFRKSPNMRPMSKFLPGWLLRYPRGKLANDVVAGVIVTILVLPQSLAYALLAGLPPQAGLYASIFPVIAYALLGSSMVQAVGPVAITAIMTYTVLSPIAVAGSPTYILLAASLALMSGLLLLAAGLLRLGFLSQLLSRPVISGFISGSAVLIVMSQIKYLLGVAADGGVVRDLLADMLANPMAQRFYIHGPTAAIGLGALALLAFARGGLGGALRRLGLAPAAAGFVVRLVPFMAVLAGMALVASRDLDGPGGVAVVGTVVEGLPGFAFFLPGTDALRILAVPALLMALIGMVQNISMAQALAIRRRERVDANAELVGLGAANVVAAFSGGMPVGGGVSRSAVNVAAGAETPLASIVSALAMLAVVAAGAHWFSRLPLAVLAASIMVAAVGMVDVRTFRQAWAYDRADALALLGTALGVIVLGLESGITLGVALSLATLLWRASVPHIAVIGRIPGSEHFRNVERYGAETIPGVLLLRIDESLFFGNLNAVEARLAQELQAAPETRQVVLIMNAVNRVDTTAMEALVELNRDLAGRGVTLHLAEVKGPVQDRLANSPLLQSLSGRVFLSVNAAFEALSSES